MFGPSGSKNVGAFIKTVVTIVPTNSLAAAAFALEGDGIDRFPAAGKQFDSCVFHLMRGETSSNPDPHEVTAKLQESSVQADGDTWTDINGTTLGPLR